MLPLKPGVLEPAANSGQRKTSRLSKKILSKEFMRISDRKGMGRGWGGNENLERIGDYLRVGR